MSMGMGMGQPSKGSGPSNKVASQQGSNPAHRAREGRGLAWAWVWAWANQAGVDSNGGLQQGKRSIGQSGKGAQVNQ
jgi:hypothetical protein